MRIPKEGDSVAIQSYKHDGSLHRTWRDTMVLKTSEDALIGCNDHTLVTESDGRRWLTREPAIIYFHQHYWFNIIAMIREGGVSYYCNLATPYVLDHEAVKYIDYDLDVKVFPDGEKRLLDVDEYEAHRRLWQYPAATDRILKANVRVLVDWINHARDHFPSLHRLMVQPVLATRSPSVGNRLRRAAACFDWRRNHDRINSNTGG